MPRISIGIPGLDEHLGGGLLPGTLTVVVGATGIGKTQFGLQFCDAGLKQEGRRGIIYDMGCRGDAQSHGDYSERMCDWRLNKIDPSAAPVLDGFFDSKRNHGDYLHVFDYHGRRVTQRDMGFEAWQEWQAEIARKLGTSIAFMYGNFVQGVRRVVVDGIEPCERPSESIQFEMFEYMYHQVVRKDSEWVARDQFRERYLQNAAAAAEHRYDPNESACLCLVTSAESMLDDLIERPLDEGDVISNANTLIYIGKVREGNKIGRSLYIAKHRGSACHDEILPYTIDDRGLRVGTT